MKETKTLNKSTTVSKAFFLLEKIALTSKPISVSELSELTEFDKTTTYRLVMTLVELGYVNRYKETKYFQLSYKVLSLGKNLLQDNEVNELIKNALSKISEITGETIHYAVLDGKETVVTHKVKGSQLVSVDFKIGDRSSLSYTSIGKVISAYQNSQFIATIIANGLSKKTEHTIVNPDEFKESLIKIREQGYAIDDHEYSNEMRCISVPIFNQGGIVNSGISISGPDSRFTIKKLLEMKISMQIVAKELSQKLGGLI